MQSHFVGTTFIAATRLCIFTEPMAEPDSRPWDVFASSSRPKTILCFRRVIFSLIQLALTFNRSVVSQPLNTTPGLRRKTRALAGREDKFRLVSRKSADGGQAGSKFQPSQNLYYIRDIYHFIFLMHYFRVFGWELFSDATQLDFFFEKNRSPGVYTSICGTHDRWYS